MEETKETEAEHTLAPLVTHLNNNSHSFFFHSLKCTSTASRIKTQTDSLRTVLIF